MSTNRTVNMRLMYRSDTRFPDQETTDINTGEKFAPVFDIGFDKEVKYDTYQAPIRDERLKVSVNGKRHDLPNPEASPSLSVSLTSYMPSAALFPYGFFDIYGNFLPKEFVGYSFIYVIAVPENKIFKFNPDMSINKNNNEFDLTDVIDLHTFQTECAYKNFKTLLADVESPNDSVNDLLKYEIMNKVTGKLYAFEFYTGYVPKENIIGSFEINRENRYREKKKPDVALNFSIVDNFIENKNFASDLKLDISTKEAYANAKTQALTLFSNWKREELKTPLPRYGLGGMTF